MIFYRLIKILNKKFNQKLVGIFPEFGLKCFINDMHNFFYIRYKSTKKFNCYFGYNSGDGYSGFLEKYDYLGNIEDWIDKNE